MKRKILLTSDGSRRDSPMVQLRVYDRVGATVELSFCIDTAADFSAMPIALAQREWIPFPQTAANRSTAAGLVGSVSKYRGVLRVRLFSTDFTWPCDFIDAPGPSSVEPYGVIGRAGFLDDFAFCVNKPYFTLRRRKLWAIFLPPWTPKHDAGEPL